MIKFEIIKDLPGGKVGDIITVYELESPKTSGSPIRGCSIGGKHWYESELLKFKEFFKPVI